MLFCFISFLFYLLYVFSLKVQIVLFFFRSTNPDRPGDLKESFDVGAVYDENFVS